MNDEEEETSEPVVIEMSLPSSFRTSEERAVARIALPLRVLLTFSASSVATGNDGKYGPNNEARRSSNN